MPVIQYIIPSSLYIENVIGSRHTTPLSSLLRILYQLTTRAYGLPSKVPANPQKSMVVKRHRHDHIDKALEFREDNTSHTYKKCHLEYPNLATSCSENIIHIFLFIEIIA